MASLTIEFRSEAAERALRQFSAHARARAIPRALNRALDSGRTVLVRAIARDLGGIKQAAVRDAIRTTPATADRLVAQLASDVRRLPLILFQARGPEPSRGRGRGVTATLGGRQVYPHAFIATLRSGHRGVFQRRPPSRSRAGGPRSAPGLPIVELRGPSIGHVFDTYTPEALRRAQEQLVKTLRSELRFAASRG